MTYRAGGDGRPVSFPKTICPKDGKLCECEKRCEPEEDFLDEIERSLADRLDGLTFS